MGGIIAGVIIGVIVLVLVIILIWWISAMNTIRRMQVSIEESLSGIDVALTKRYDLLTKQLGATKGYLEHEKETLALVTSMRTGVQASSKKSIEDLQNISNQMDQVSKAVNIAFERYPDLKSNENVMYLQASVTEVEEHLQASRRLYNSNVSSYNKYIIVFPSSIVAHHLKAENREFFKVEEGKAQDIEIKF